MTLVADWLMFPCMGGDAAKATTAVLSSPRGLSSSLAALPPSISRVGRVHTLAHASFIKHDCTHTTIAYQAALIQHVKCESCNIVPKVARLWKTIHVTETNSNCTPRLMLRVLLNVFNSLFEITDKQCKFLKITRCGRCLTALYNFASFLFEQIFVRLSKSGVTEDRRVSSPGAVNCTAVMPQKPKAKQLWK